MKYFDPTQFSLFRIIFGIYLTVHFWQLLPNAAEVFSNQGVIKDSTLLPSFGKLPLPIFFYDDPASIENFVISLVCASILFTMGYFRRTMSLYIFFGWMSLFNRNPLISNPSIGYIGWLLLACSLIQSGERLGFLLTKKQREDEYQKDKYRWEVSDVLFFGSWIVVGTSYTASGIHKLQCQSWLDGTALDYVLTGPLVRENNLMVSLILILPFGTKMMTWGSLFLEVSALFIGTFHRTRSTYWLLFMGFHVGILLTVNFTDLTLGMMIAHLFTFDASWFEFTRKLVVKYDRNDHPVIETDINHTSDINRKPIMKILTETLMKKPFISEESDNDSTSSNNSNDNDNDNDITIDKHKQDQSNMQIWSIYAFFVFVIALLINTNNYSLSEMIERFTQLTLDMYWGFGILVGILAILMILERIFPDQELKHVEGWWISVLIINIFQLFAVILASFTWENWLQNSDYYVSTKGFHLRDHVSPFTGGLIAYFITTWLFYHWHKARHEVYFLWILFHQFHHSATRIETITSFYKHPLEIVIDSQILAILLYSVLGLTNESSIWLSIFSGIGEYFYHMNIKTPVIIGYVFQRPEAHRAHHRQNARLHCPNYSDFSLWDFLGGTWENPTNNYEPTGFSNGAELQRVDMMMFKDVLFSGYQNIFSDFKKFKKVVKRYLSYTLVAWGSLNAVAFMVHYDGFRSMGTASVSSPLPLVFSSFNGVETFATKFFIDVHFNNGTTFETVLDGERYNMMGGCYNRRNVYGVIFSHGPFFDKENMITIRQEILKYAVCDPKTVLNEFQIIGNISHMNISVGYRPENDKIIGNLYIECN